MNSFVEMLRTHGNEWLLVTTFLLLLGVGIQTMVGNRLLKQRIGELTIACILVWLALAIVPLPRWDALSRGNSKGPLIAHVDDTTSSQPPRVASGDWPRSKRSKHGVLIGGVDGRSATETGFSVSPLRTSLFQLSDLAEKPGGDSGSLVTPTRSGSASGANQRRQATDSIASIVLTIYLSGSLLAAVWLAAGYVFLRVIQSRSSAVGERVDGIYRNLQPEGGPVVRLTEGPGTFIAGVIRPQIMLPRRVRDNSSDEEIRCLLLHELAHWHQRDVWGRAIFNLALPLLYFHPLYWMARTQSDLSAELIADRIAAEAVDPGTYVESLVRIARQLKRRRGWIGSPCYRGATSFFGKRMDMLLQSKSITVSLSRKVQQFCTVVALCVSVLSASLWGQAPDPGQAIDRLRHSLRHGSADSSSEIASTLLPEDTLAFFSVDVSGIQRSWSVRQQQLISGEQADSPGIGFFLTSFQNEIGQRLDRLGLSRSELLEVANGQIAFAICPMANGEIASAVLVDTSARQEQVDQMINAVGERTDDGELTLSSIEGKRFYSLGNGRDRLLMLPMDRELILTNNASLLKKLVSPGATLATSSQFVSAKANALTRMGQRGEAPVFGYVRPVEYTKHVDGMTDQSRQERRGNSLAQLLVEPSCGLDAKSLFFAVRSVGDTLITETFLESSDPQNKFASFLQPLEKSQWGSTAPAGLTDQVTMNVDWPSLLENIGPVIDRSSGTEGSFRRALASLRDDPSGPRVDVYSLVARLDSKARFYRHFVEPGSTPEWMVEVPILRDADLTRMDLASLLGTSYLEKHNGDLQYWQYDSTIERDLELDFEFEDEFADPLEEDAEEVDEIAWPHQSFTVYQNRLLIASTPEMLRAMTESVSPHQSLEITPDFGRVLSLIDFDPSDSVYGFWFARTRDGLSGTTLHRQSDGWKIRNVLQTDNK